MGSFQFQKRGLSGLQLISPFYAEDRRGFFLKSFEQNIFKQHGIDIQVFEIFCTKSVKGTIRGLHFQRRHSQDKLVQVLHGAVYDVAVDLRKGSETFGQWEGFYLSAENRNLLYIPKGFAHGFLALEEGTLFSYLCGDRYDPESDGGVRWDDPTLAVKWPLEQIGQPVLSEKDAHLPLLSELDFGKHKER